MLAWFRRGAALPPAARSMARQLLADFHALGLFAGATRRAFEADLLATLGAPLLEDLAKGWAGASSPESAEARHVRQQVAARLGGVHSDWRFDPADVLEKVERLLPGRSRLRGRRQPRGEAVVDGRRRPVFHVTVALDDDPSVHWRCSSLLGFMDAVNQAVAQAGHAGRFVALQTDGDYHAFVYADPGARARLAASPLMPLAREADPLSGPVAADAK